MKPRKAGKQRTQRLINQLNSFVKIAGYFKFKDYTEIRLARAIEPDNFGFTASANCQAVRLDHETKTFKRYRRFRRTNIFHLYHVSDNGHHRLVNSRRTSCGDHTAPYMDLRDISRHEDRNK